MHEVFALLYFLDLKAVCWCGTKIADSKSVTDQTVRFQTQATLQPKGERLSVHPFPQQLRPYAHVCSDSRQSLSWALSSLSSCEATDNRFLQSIHNMPLQTISGTVFISAMILWNNFFFNYVFTLRLRWKS